MVLTLRVLLMLLLVGACSERDAPSVSDAGASGTAGVGGSGAGSGGATPPAPHTGGASASDRPCTPTLQPGDEFYVACDDAALPHVEPDASVPAAGDAAIPTQPDASEPPEPDAGEPPDALDEGPCAMRTTSCDVGRAAATIGAATCTINGNYVIAERETCEVCSKPTLIVDYLITIMDCGVCAHVFSAGGIADEPIAADECRSRADVLDLSWTLSDPACIDVYAYVGSGATTGASTVVQVSDQVRICRCDRTTDTCIACVDGACGDVP
jgi:hypothetical protein